MSLEISCYLWCFKVFCRIVGVFLSHHLYGQPSDNARRSDGPPFAHNVDSWPPVDRRILALLSHATLGDCDAEPMLSLLLKPADQWKNSHDDDLAAPETNYASVLDYGDREQGRGRRLISSSTAPTIAELDGPFLPTVRRGVTERGFTWR
jgi:hypothetical protein